MKKIDSKYLWALAIFVTALAIRIVYFLQVKANFPGWDTPTIDPLYHDLWAKQIASGQILGTGAFFRAPFYAYFLGFLYAIFGPSLAIAKIIQHGIGALTCSLLFLFADKYFNRRVSVIAGLLAAFSWVLVYHEDELLLDSLLVLFGVTLIWLLMRAAEKPDGWRFLVSGLVLGLACITRPNYLAILPVILIWLLVMFGRQYSMILRQFLILALGSAILILPVALRNRIVGHDNVLIASQGGINFYIGNNRYADGASAVVPEFGATWQYADAEYLAKKETGRLGQEMKPSEVSSFYYWRGLEFMRNNPLAWLGLTIKKLDYFWNSFEISNNQNLYFYRRFASVTTLLPPLLAVISPLSIMGLVIAFGLGRKYHIIGYFVIGYMATVVAFFVNSRFRLPVLPFLMILAALAFWKGFDLARRKTYGKLWIFALALLVFLVLTNVDFFGISRGNFAMSHFSLGNVYLKKRMMDRALDEYGVALKMADCVPKAHLNRGVIFFARQEYDKARQEFELELEKCRLSAQAHNNLSVLDRLGGNANGALIEAREAIAIMPQYLEAYINEILAMRMLGDNDAAYRAADSLTVMFPDYLPGHYFKGLSLVENDQLSSAAKEFQLILASGPQDIVERYDLSTIYSAQVPYGLKPERVVGFANYEMGLLMVKGADIDSALIYFKKTTEILPEYSDAWTNLALAYDSQGMYREALAAFKTAIQLDPGNPLTYYNCGLTLGKLGMLSEAAQFFKQALDLKPDLAAAREKLKITESLLKSNPQK